MSEVSTVTEASTKGKILVVPPILLGCDPELFFERNGMIIGAEKVLPEGGILPVRGQLYQGQVSPGNNFENDKGIVLDGVQVELNPKPANCRQVLAKRIQYSMVELKKRLEALGDKEIKVSFRSNVKLKRSELDSLGEKAKTFGCAPSLNAYDKSSKSVMVDASKYLRRSAGGHIHLGLSHNLLKERERLPRLLDIMLGIPSVMMDRDPDAAIRRKYYGKAGEYRLPKHGLEYRTLSNFWMRALPLTSLVWGQARNAVKVLATTLFKAPIRPKEYHNSPIYTQEWWDKQYDRSVWDAEKELYSKVDILAVRKAINKNDLDLALKCWEGVKEFTNDHLREGGGYGITSTNLKEFEYFCSKIWEHGLEYWFKGDPMENWLNYSNWGVGWESFAITIGDKMRRKL